MQPEGRQDGSSGLRISLLGGFSVAVGAERAPFARVDPLKAWVAQAMTELSASASATGTEEVS